MTRVTNAGRCRYCQAPAFIADDDGPVHACCRAWRDVIAAGYGCPSCEARGELVARTAPRKLPLALPGGSPFRPYLVISKQLYSS
jgi:hypothetical protein